MKSSKVLEFFKDGNIVIPIYFLKRYNDFGISAEAFIFLMYLYNLGSNSIFDPERFSRDLNVGMMKIMENISLLTDKKLLRVDVSKDDKGVIQEVIILDDFYSKLSLIAMDEVVNDEKKVSEDSNIFEVIEQEFGRTLTPMEYEISKAWLDNGISEELIREAIKEATMNGVSNLRYIDKILYEWGKNNINTAEDVENNRKKHKQGKEKIDEDVDLDIVDWNWFDE